MPQTPEQIIMYHKRKMLVQQMKKPKKLKRSPKWLYPKAHERTFTAYLNNYVTSQDKIIDEFLNKQLPLVYQEYESQQPVRIDSYLDSFKKLMDQLQISIDDHFNSYGIGAYSLDIGQKVNTWNNAQWQKTLKSVLGISTGAYSAKTINDVEMFSYDTVDLIKTMGNQRLEKLRQHVLNGFRNGTRHEVVREQIKADYKTTHSRAKLIARDQIAKLNGKLMHTRQAELGVTKYIWRGTPDERIRKTHKNMDGKICRWDDQSKYYNPNTKRWINRSNVNGVSLHPGQDYQCRCWAEAIFDFTDVEGPQVTETALPQVLKGVAVGAAAVAAGVVGAKVAKKAIVKRKLKPKLYVGPYRPAVKPKPRKPAPIPAIPGPVIPVVPLPPPEIIPGRVPLPKIPRIILPKPLTPEKIHNRLIRHYRSPVITEKYDMIKAIEDTGIHIVDKPYMADKVDYGLLHKLMERSRFYSNRFNYRPKNLLMPDEEKTTFLMSTRVWRSLNTGELDYFEMKLGSRFVRNNLREFENVMGHAIACGEFPLVPVKSAIKAIIDHEYGHVIWREMPIIGYQEKLVTLWNSLKADDIIKKISSNAASNIDEFVADGFAEYMNTLYPRPFAKQIGDIIGKFLITKWRK